MTGWTLDELARRVAEALAADEVRAPNGRVREVPDARAIRWYSTIGLVDRPLGFRGRTALYGPRHLLQIVAVKRRQAEGEALAQIQTELAGASDDALGRVARIPAELLSAEDGPAPTPPAATRPAKFWATPPAAVRPAATRAAATAPGTARLDLRYLVTLAGGVTLALPAAPSSDDVAAIRAAAEPLIHLLADRGLHIPEEPRDDR
jgi:hypothetical protein